MEELKCKKCGKPVVNFGIDGIAHNGAGETEQKCQNCGWVGGQAGGYTKCPRCGDATNLVNDHSAS